MSIIGISDSVLDANAVTLMQAASRESGFEDFGDDSFVPHLARYLEAMSEASPLSEAGRSGLLGSVVRYLVARLRCQADFTEHPEILDEEIVAPVFVIGLPRTGTTRLQRLLSQDPTAQALLGWRVVNPAPFPGWKAGKPDARVEVAETLFRSLEESCPELMLMHPQAADEAEEDGFLLLNSFQSICNASALRAPSYVSYVQAQSQIAAYEYERRLLQYLQWQDGGGRGRPWILKSPPHTGRLLDLLAVFPDATLIHCHRDVSTVWGSFCRIMEHFWAISGHEEIDLHALGRMLLQFWSFEFANHVQQREQLSEGRIIDVSYERINKDAIGEMDRIYATRGLTLSGEAARQMETWLTEHPGQGPGGARSYSYSLNDYGLTPAEIKEAFSGYLAVCDSFI